MVIRPPVKWHGGKRYLAKKIIPHFPSHRCYLEPFGGAASVLLNKPPCEVETYNDLNLRISRLFSVLRTNGEEFQRQLQFVPYSRVEFDAAADPAPTAGDVELAVADFIRWRQSFGGQGKSWSYTTSRSRGGIAGDVNAWWTSIEALPEICDRLRMVQITCEPAVAAIKRFDQPGGLIYCDPPYVHSTRAKGSRDVYDLELTDDDHCELASVLRGCKSSVVLSGYPSPLYDDLYAGWRTVDVEIANHAAGGATKARQTERLWFNF